MRQKKSFKQFFLNKKKIFFTIFFIFVIFILLRLNNFFLIRTVKIVSEEDKVELIGLDNIKNKNIFFLDEKKASAELLQKNPYLKKVNLRKNYPHQLIIEVTIDQPIAALKTNQGFFLLSEKGKIISKKKDDDKNLPLINYYQNFYYYQYQAGELIDYKEIITALKWLKLINDLGLKVDTVDIAGWHMVAFNLGEKKIIFSLEKDYQVQAYQLATIIKQFKIEGRGFSSLDLRFDKPVIRF